MLNMFNQGKVITVFSNCAECLKALTYLKNICIFDNLHKQLSAICKSELRESVMENSSSL